MADESELLTCPVCGRVWDGFAQCFPCEPPSPAESENTEYTSDPAVVAAAHFEGLRDPQGFFVDVHGAAHDDAARKRVREALE